MLSTTSQRTRRKGYVLPNKYATDTKLRNTSRWTPPMPIPILPTQPNKIKPIAQAENSAKGCRIGKRKKETLVRTVCTSRLTHAEAARKIWTECVDVYTPQPPVPIRELEVRLGLGTIDPASLCIAVHGPSILGDLLHEADIIELGQVPILLQVRALVRGHRVDEVGDEVVRNEGVAEVEFRDVWLHHPNKS